MAVRLNLGCGASTINRPGWLNVDLAPRERSAVPILPLDIRGPLMWGDGEVDEILSSHSLEHVEEPVAVLREWHRVLKPGGVLTIAVPDGTHKAEWIGVHEAFLAARGEAHKDLEDHHIDFTPATLRAALEAAGPWSSIEPVRPMEDWRLPIKAWWQVCVRATK